MKKKGKKKQAEAKESESDSSEDERVKNRPRENEMLKLSDDYDYRSAEAIQARAKFFTGIRIEDKEKLLEEKHLDLVLFVFEKDNKIAQAKFDFNLKKGGIESIMGKKDEGNPDPRINYKPGSYCVQEISANQPNRFDRLTDLCFSEIRFTTAIIKSFAGWVKNCSYCIRSLSFIQLKFQEKNNFKELCTAVGGLTKLMVFSVSHMAFENEMYGKSMAIALEKSVQLTEFNISFIKFDHPKSFFDMVSPMLSPKCRINKFSMQACILTPLESKVLCYILMKNKLMHTVDFSECIDKERDSFVLIFDKFGQGSNVRYLSLQGILPDLNFSITKLGIALAENTKIETLNISNNRIKTQPFTAFFAAIKNNKSLRKINASKTDLSDKVCEKIADFLSMEELRLHEFDLSKNQITDVGFKLIMPAIQKNRSIEHINFDQNQLKASGCEAISACLEENKSIVELSLSGNKINNDGIALLGQFLKNNETLFYLDISKNPFTDQGFSIFAEHFGESAGLVYLDIQKTKDISDDQSLIQFAQALEKNKSLKTLDLTGIKLRKQFLVENLNTALQTNITLTKVIGKIQEDTIQEQLLVNNMIDEKIVPQFDLKPKHTKKSIFNFRSVDPDNISYLDISETDYTHIHPSFKFMRFHNVRAVNFANTGFANEHMIVLSDYVRTNPPLYSIVLDDNPFTDTGINTLAEALKVNTNVCHLAFRKCKSLSRTALGILTTTLHEINMALYQIDFDTGHFEEHSVEQVMSNGKLNMKIQQKLKPTLSVTTKRKMNFADEDPIEEKGFLPEIGGSQPSSGRTSQIIDPQELVSTVVFVKDAQVANCFDAILKVFRIMKPNVIDLQDCGLVDEHLEELLAFMKNKEMVKELNLRRNKIGNQGATALANFITSHDNTLQDVDLNRNWIEEAGAQKLIDAIHKTIRIEKFAIGFGNLISQYLVNAVDQELLSNKQIKENLKKEMGVETVSLKNLLVNKAIAKKFSRMKYEVLDKGPNYMRSALKTVRLLNILHLSLTDNMLGIKEAVLLSNLIRANTALRILNLSGNNFASDSAMVLGDSILENDHLLFLDLSMNRFGDLGIRNILYPLLIRGLQKAEVINTDAQAYLDMEAISQIGESNKEDITQRASTTRSRNDPIKQSKLQAINLKDNYMTQDSLRHVWLLLEVNTDLLVAISEPNPFNWNFEQVKKPKFSETKELSGGSIAPSKMVISSDSENENQDEDDENDSKKFKQCCCKCFQKCVCFTDFNKIYEISKNIPNCGTVFCWRYKRSQQMGQLFFTNVKARKILSESSQLLLTIWMIANYLFMSLSLLLPYLSIFFFDATKEQTDLKLNHINLPLFKLINTAVFTFLAGTFIWETIYVISLHRSMGIKCNCMFVFTKIFSGTLRRCMGILQSIVATTLIETGLHNQYGYYIGILLAICQLIIQSRCMYLVCQSYSLLSNEILANIERNERLANATHYEAIGSLMARLSIRPTSAMLRQAERLDDLKFEEREKEVIEAEKSFYGWPEESNLPKYNHSIDHKVEHTQKCCHSSPKCRRFLENFSSTRFWHLCFCTFPLLLISTFNWTMTTKISEYAWLGVFACSMASMISQLLNLFMSRPIRIIDSEHVWSIVQIRISLKQPTYDRYLNGEASLGSSAGEESDHPFVTSSAEEEEEESKSFEESEIEKEDEKKERQRRLSRRPGKFIDATIDSDNDQAQENTNRGFIKGRRQSVMH